MKAVTQRQAGNIRCNMKVPDWSSKTKAAIPIRYRWRVVESLIVMFRCGLPLPSTQLEKQIAHMFHRLRLQRPSISSLRKIIKSRVTRSLMGSRSNFSVAQTCLNNLWAESNFWWFFINLQATSCHDDSGSIFKLFIKLHQIAITLTRIWNLNWSWSSS